MKNLRLTADVSIEASAEEGKRPTFEIHAYSGGPLKNVGGFYTPVVLELSGMTAREPLPILRDHDSRRLVGAATDVRIDESGVWLSGTITGDDADAQGIITHAKNGFSWQASIGAGIIRQETLKAGNKATVNGREITGPALIVRQSRLHETSFVAIPADESTTAAIAAERDNMSEENEAGTVVAADETRFAAELAGLSDSFIDRYPMLESEIRDATRGAIEAGTNPNSFRLELYELTTTVAPARASGGHSSSGRGTPRESHIAAGIMVRAGYADAAVTAFGEQTVEAAERQPIELSQLINVQAQGWSTGSVPNVLSNVANKVASEAYRLTPSTWTGFTSIKNTRDFKQSGAIRLNTLGGLEPLSPNGELRHASFSDEKYDFRVSTFGKMASLSREDIINDDLGMFADVVPSLARMARRSLDDAVWKALMNAGAHYSSDNGNLLTTGSILDTDSLGEAVAMLRKQTGPNGEPLGIPPKVLVVGPDNEMTARALLNSTEVLGSAGPAGNPLRGVVGLEVEPRIGNESIKVGATGAEWFLFGGPADTPFIVAYQGGQKGPKVETSDTAFNTLGVQFRVYMDYGVALADPKASVYATGASD